jgi:hypothetical protein
MPHYFLPEPTPTSYLRDSRRDDNASRFIVRAGKNSECDDWEIMKQNCDWHASLETAEQARGDVPACLQARCNTPIVLDESMTS